MPRAGQTLDYVRRHYDVPVRRGMRVTTYRGEGKVTCGDGAHVRVRVDGERHSDRYHPLSLDYLDGVEKQDRLDEHNRAIDAWNDWLNGRAASTEEGK